MSYETTVENRKRYVEDAFKGARAIALTDTKWTAKEEDLKPLYDDAMRIADGTWEKYREKLDQRKHLFNEAVKALVEMGNCSSQRHLNKEQANAIETFLSFDGGDRDGLCVDIWEKASPKIHNYWRDGTFNALEELRTKELYCNTYSRGCSI